MDEHDDPVTATTVPHGLPVLTPGRHRRPEFGACVMEYVSLLAGEPWSDAPRCTDRALGELARRVNDDVGPQARGGLVEVAPLLVGARAPGVADIVVAAVARVGLEQAPGDPVLIRTERQARARVVAADLAARPPTRAARLRRALAGVGLVTTTYFHVVLTAIDLPRTERDAVRLRALAEAVGDVRAAARRTCAPADEPAPRVRAHARS